MTSADPSGVASPRRNTVLLVDDEHDILDALKDTIEAYLPDVDVLTAMSGPDALAVLRTHPVDLIVTDYKMPMMNGLEFLAEAKHVAPTVPRIMMTAYPDLDLAVRALNEEHIANFLMKPLDRVQIVQVIASMLHERRSLEMRSRAFAGALDAVRRELAKVRGGAASPPRRA